MKIYVGNLSYTLTEEELRQEFAAHGEVTSATIATDRYSDRPKGFGFVEMPKKSEADAAITALNGKMLKERAIVVNEARPRSDSGRGGGSFGNRGGGRGFGGGGRGGGGGGGGGFNQRGGQRRY